MVSFGKRIKAACKTKGATLDAVAKVCRSHKGYISGIENGKVNAPSIRMVKRLCAFLDMDYFRMALVMTIEKAKDPDVREYLEAVCQDELGGEPEAVAAKPKEAVAV